MATESNRSIGGIKEETDSNRRAFPSFRHFRKRQPTQEPYLDKQTPYDIRKTILAETTPLSVPKTCHRIVKPPRLHMRAWLDPSQHQHKLGRTARAASSSSVNSSAFRCGHAGVIWSTTVAARSLTDSGRAARARLSRRRKSASPCLG